MALAVGEVGGPYETLQGYFLLTIDPQSCGGSELRVVIEAKNRALAKG